MKRNESSEQELFDGWHRRSTLDDSMSETHQADLRVSFLQAFDAARHCGAVALPEALPAPATKSVLNASQGFAVIAAVAVCIFIALALRTGHERDFSHRTLTVLSPSVEHVDSSFVDSLFEVNALQEEHSAEQVFMALAVCQREQEAARSVNQQNQMRLFYELLLLSSPPNSPKG